MIQPFGWLVRLEGFICKSKKFFLLLKRMRPFGHKVARSGWTLQKVRFWMYLSYGASDLFVTTSLCSVGIFLIKEKNFWSQGVTQKIHKNLTFELSDNKPNCFEVFSEIHKSLNKFALNRSVTLHKNSTIFSPYCTTNIYSPLCTYCTMDFHCEFFRSITLHLVTFNHKIGSNPPKIVREIRSPTNIPKEIPIYFDVYLAHKP